MAQLKSTVVQGSLRVTNTTYTNDLIVSDVTAPTIANNDYLLVADSSDGNKLLKGPVFDGSTATQALTKAGTWATFNNYSHPSGDGNLHVPATGTSNNGKFLKAGSTAGSLSWATAVTSLTIKTTSPVTGGSNTATTTTGTYTIALSDGYGDTKNPYASKTKNYVLAAPSTANGAPSFRALVPEDLPVATASTLGIVKAGLGLKNTNGVLAIDGVTSMTDTTHSGNDVLTKYGWKRRFQFYDPGGTNFNSVNGISELRTFLINMAGPVGYQGVTTISCRNMPDYTYLHDDAYTCYLSCIQRAESGSSSVVYETGTAILIPLSNLERVPNSSETIRNANIVIITFDEQNNYLNYYRVFHRMKNKSYEYTLFANQWQTGDAITQGYHCNAYYDCPNISGLKDISTSLQAIVGMTNNSESREHFFEESEALASACLESQLSYPSDVSSNGNLTLYCHGEIPTIDLHITLMIVG